MARGEPIQRVLAVLLALERAPGGRRASELAAQLDLSSRTIQRAFHTLESSGFPLTVLSEGRERRWRLLSLPHRSPSFTSGEALSLLIAERLAPFGLKDTVVADPLKSASRKVRAMLPPEASERLLALAQRELGLPGPHHDYARRDVEIAALRRAIRQQLTVHIRYRSLRQRPRPRSLDPYLLVHHQGALYTVGFCHRRQAVRVFLVDRILSVHVTSRAFRQVPGFSARDYFHGTFGVFRGRVRTIRLRFDSAVAAWATERIWHESQKWRVSVDGSAELTLQVAATPDLVASILAFGRHVQVLEPRALAAEVAREWFAAAAGSKKGLSGKEKDARPKLTQVGRNVVLKKGRRLG